MSQAGQVLQVRGLSKRFGGLLAVDGVTFDVNYDEIFCLIGANGAGKTTVFNLIAGALRPTTGTILLEGRDVSRLSAHRRVRLGIGRTFQLVLPFVSMTVRENVVVSALGAGASRALASERADQTLAQLGLTALARVSAGDLNAVQGKRLELARALGTSPRVLLLDEIFAGLNPEETDELVALVTDIRASGQTILVVEHNLHAVRQVADRVVAMDSGSLVAEGMPDEVFNDPRVVESYLGHRSRA